MKNSWVKIRLTKIRQVKFLVLILLMLNLILLGYLLYLPTKKSPATPQYDLNTERGKLEQLILDKGPIQSYQELKQKYVSDPFTGHQKAHLFGELLYANLGFDGVKVCDNSLGFGCYHGLIIAAITQQGVNSIYKLDQACIDKFGPLGLGCQHGIGHGIMEYLGLNKLAQALELCHSLTWKGKLLGCQSGALMEYISPNSLENTNQASPNLYLNPNQPLGPCPDLAEQFQMACYYEMRRWWNSIYNQDFSKMVRICDSLKNNQLVKICVMGIGYTIAEDNRFKFESSIKSCNSLGSILNQDYCIFGLNWAFKDDGYSDLADKSCQQLDISLNQACHLESDLTKY